MKDTWSMLIAQLFILRVLIDKKGKGENEIRREIYGADGHEFSISELDVLLGKIERIGLVKHTFEGDHGQKIFYITEIGLEHLVRLEEDFFSGKVFK